jgi:hypothetical protein
MAAVRGPYCTGAFTPYGACALVRAPQPGHSRSIIWCSVTSALTGGISVTCRPAGQAASPRRAWGASPRRADGQDCRDPRRSHAATPAARPAHPADAASP